MYFEKPICLSGSVKVKMTPRDINVVEGEKLRIMCTVIGNPTPTLSWIVCKSDHFSIINNLLHCICNYSGQSYLHHIRR